MLGGEFAELLGQLEQVPVGAVKDLPRWASEKTGLIKAVIEVS